jgi:hypothetical protein
MGLVRRWSLKYFLLRCRSVRCPGRDKHLSYNTKKHQSPLANLNLPLLQAVVSHQCVKKEVSMEHYSPIFILVDSLESLTSSGREVDAKVGALLLRSYSVGEAHACVPPAAVLVADL